MVHPEDPFLNALGHLEKHLAGGLAGLQSAIHQQPVFALTEAGAGSPAFLQLDSPRLPLRARCRTVGQSGLIGEAVEVSPTETPSAGGQPRQTIGDIAKKPKAVEGEDVPPGDSAVDAQKASALRADLETDPAAAYASIRAKVAHLRGLAHQCSEPYEQASDANAAKKSGHGELEAAWTL